MWGWIAWIAVALAVWVAVAAFVGVLLGRVVRRRDRQVHGLARMARQRGDEDGIQEVRPDEGAE